MHWEYSEDVSPCVSRGSPFHSGSFWIPGDANNATTLPTDAPNGLGSVSDAGMTQSKSPAMQSPEAAAHVPQEQEHTLSKANLKTEKNKISGCEAKGKRSIIFQGGKTKAR